MKCKCIRMPEGDNGLEGYNTGFIYRCELVHCGSTSRGWKGPYWRVWPEEESSYYETCGPVVFKRYFKVQPE